MLRIIPGRATEDGANKDQVRRGHKSGGAQSPEWPLGAQESRGGWGNAWGLASSSPAVAPWLCKLQLELEDGRMSLSLFGPQSPCVHFGGRASKAHPEDLLALTYSCRAPPDLEFPASEVQPIAGRR